MEGWRGEGERKFQQAMSSLWEEGRRRETRKERDESNARGGIGSRASDDRGAEQPKKGIPKRRGTVAGGLLCRRDGSG